MIHLHRVLITALATAVLAQAGCVANGHPNGQASGNTSGLSSGLSSAARSSVQAPRVRVRVPPIRHVFVINIENKGFTATWGSGSAAPYLSKTLRSKGVLLTRYYGTAHNSQPNYVAQISGQGPNPQMQSDCKVYSQFRRVRTTATGQAVGTGCVFPADVASLPTQLTARGVSWKGYLQGMTRPCEHPVLNQHDNAVKAKVGAEYATRHNPFVYFRAITASASGCAKHVVALPQLSHDLTSAKTTPGLSYITPDLCSDGHDAPCVDGRPGGLRSVDAWMRVWVPKIVNSAAFKAAGMLIITADEADSALSDARACCGERAGPNSALPGLLGPGGGRIGALVISRWTRPGTTSSRPYNHYSLLGSVENIFGLPYLGYAKAGGLNRFGRDVYSTGW